MELDLDKTCLIGVKLLSGSITLARCIGKGASGAVYLAHDTTITGDKCRVAVKVVNLPRFKRHHDQLLNEIRFLRRMSDDPSIPTLRHVIEDDHFVFLIMVRLQVVLAFASDFIGCSPTSTPP